MSILNGKNVLLGVTGGIAAYKTASLVRLFVKSGANIKVVMRYILLLQMKKMIMLLGIIM